MHRVNGRPGGLLAGNRALHGEYLTVSAIRSGGRAGRAATHGDDVRSDAALATAAATGNTEAFEALYRRHAEAAWRVASAVAGNPDDAADAVSDAFTRVLSALEAGRLNDGARFRPYLLSATRNAAVDFHRRSGRLRPTDRLELLDFPATGRTATERVDDRQDATFVAQAFRGLPERWRSVLWLVEVEGVPPREAAALLGLSANNVAQLALRARVGLRERFVQAHLREPFDDVCRFCVERLGSYVVGTLSPRDLAKVDQHLAGCEECRERAAQLEDLGGSLRRVVLPLPFLLAPAALAKWQLTSSVGSAVHGVASAVGGTTSSASTVASSAGSLAAKVQRPLMAASTGLFALGVISASVVGQPGDLGGRIGSPRLPVIATPAPPSQVVDDRIALTISTSASSIAGLDDLVALIGQPVTTPALAPAPALAPGAAPGASTGSGDAAPAGPSPADRPSGDASAPPTPPPPKPTPLVNAGVSVVIAGQSAGITAGSGTGSCTGGALGPAATGCPPPAATGTVVGTTVATDGSAGGGVLAGKTVSVSL